MSYNTYCTLIKTAAYATTAAAVVTGVVIAKAMHEVNKTVYNFGCCNCQCKDIPEEAVDIGDDDV